MIQLTEKTEVIIRIFCVVILISLCLAIYIKGLNLTCDKCVITFKQERAYGRALNPPIQFEVKLDDIYNNFTKNEGFCLVEWIESNGFVDRTKRIREENVS